MKPFYDLIAACEYMRITDGEFCCFVLYKTAKPCIVKRDGLGNVTCKYLKNTEMFEIAASW